jgi:hypothetical protein
MGKIMNYEDVSLDEIKKFIDRYSNHEKDDVRFQISMGRELKELSDRSLMMQYISLNSVIDDVSFYITYTNSNEFDLNILPTVVSIYASSNETLKEEIKPSLLSGCSTYNQESTNGNKLTLFDMPNELIDNSRQIMNQIKQEGLSKGNQLSKNNGVVKSNYLEGFVDALLLAFITGIFAGIILAISYYVIVTFA